MKKTTLEFKYAVHCLGVVSNYTVNRRPVEELHPAFEKEMVAIIAEVQQEQAAELSRLRAIETAANDLHNCDGNMNADAIGVELLNALRAALETK